MPHELNLREKHRIVQDLWTYVNDGGDAVDIVPKIVRKVLETEAWREREWNGRLLCNSSFREFIERKPMDGCGWRLDKVRNLLRYDPETLAEYEKAIVGKHGGDRKSKRMIKSDNITLATDRGTSLSYTLRRLKSQRPDLFDRVVAGEMSANAAAIAAGFRKKPSPFDQVRKLLPKLTDAEWAELVKLRPKHKQ